MNIRDVVPVSSLANQFGTKAIVYGGPGTGKTPLLTTVPNGIICATEPGFKSIRKSGMAAFLADTYAKQRDFWRWATSSNEARQFETKCCDSISQMAEIILEEERKAGGKDPRKFYGELSLKMMEIMNMIYFAPGMNALLIAKEGSLESDGITKFRPYFPGQDLNIKIPHLYDSVWRIELLRVQDGSMQRVIRTKENHNAFARERSGNLAELEPPDINYLFNKSSQ